MDFRDTLSALLPPPRDDEPAGLRQDILDELADHLTCAYNRELLRGADPRLARQRVLQRFGDPAAVARRLWLDAMRGKIMAQRMLIATCVLVMLACVTSLGLAWNWMNQDRLLRRQAAAEAVESNRRMTEALVQAQATNKDMLNKLGEMFDSIRHPISPDWIPVTFKLTEETMNGPAVSGCSLSLTPSEGNAGARRSEVGKAHDDLLAFSPTFGARRQLRLVLPPGLTAASTAGQFGGMGGTGMGTAAPKSIFRTSDALGIADFGVVQPGDYRFLIIRDWATGRFGLSGEFNVAPGGKVQKLIVCPRTPPERATVRVRCSWPADLEKEGLVVYAPFSFRYRNLDSGQEWALTDSSSTRRLRGRPNREIMMNPSLSPAVRAVLCGPETMFAEILRQNRLYFWTYSATDLAGKAIERVTPGVWADILATALREVNSPPDAPERPELAWELGTYGLDSLIVLRPARAQNVDIERRRFDVLLGSFANSFGPVIEIRGELPNSAVRVPSGIQDRGGPPTRKDLERSSTPFPEAGLGGGMAGNLWSGWQAWGDELPLVALSAEFWDKVDIAFDAESGRVNEWTIPLPDELITAVRQAIKTGPAPKKKPGGQAASPEASGRASQGRGRS